MTEPLALLLLPRRLEDFELEGHARGLLNIPRVIALEPSRKQTPRLLRDTISVRQAKRLRLPGEPRVLVLYRPAQYPLARALMGRYGGSELWYLRADPETLRGEGPYSRDELLELDELARERAVRSPLIGVEAVESEVDEELCLRLHELEIISARVFVPGGRVHDR